MLSRDISSFQKTGSPQVRGALAFLAFIVHTATATLYSMAFSPLGLLRDSTRVVLVSLLPSKSLIR